MRVDQWLWAVRIFKSRTLAGEAARRGQVSINGRPAKAAALVSPGQTVEVEGRLRGVKRRCVLTVLALPTTRVSASKVAEFMDLRPLPDAPTSKEPEWWDNSQWWGEVDEEPGEDS